MSQGYAIVGTRVNTFFKSIGFVFLAFIKFQSVVYWMQQLFVQPMKSSDVSYLLSELYNNLHEEQVREYYEQQPKNKERIVDLCQKIVLPLQAGLDNSDQLTAYDVFSLLCNPDLFSRLELWSYDEDIMLAALALYSALPPTLFEAYHAKHLANSFSQTCKSGTARNRLICSLLQGPKDHWKAAEIENMYYTFMEMEGDMALETEYQNQPISSVQDFLSALETLSRSQTGNSKSAKDTLYSTVFCLLGDDRLKLYPDIFSKLHGYTLVKKCVQSHHHPGRVMDNLDRMISDQQLEQWFPKSGVRVNELAQSYPRLKAMLEKRNLLHQISSTTPRQGRSKML